MDSKIKNEINKIEIPNDLSTRSRIGVMEAKSEMKNNTKYWTGFWVTAAVFVLSFALSFNSGVIASVPIVGQMIEQYINRNSAIDYSSYKTSIGETADSELGQLTLNEIMIDDKQLFLSAMYKPADHVDFDAQTYITPSVKINGKDYSLTTGGQTIDLNDSMFTLNNDIELTESIDTGTVEVEISYDTWNLDTPIEQPWTFDVKVSQEQLLGEKKTLNIAKEIELSNGSTITIDNVVTTPISTTIYFQLSEDANEHQNIIIQTEEGEFSPHSKYTSNELDELSYARFNGVNLLYSEFKIKIYDETGRKLLNEYPIKMN